MLLAVVMRYLKYGYVTRNSNPMLRYAFENQCPCPTKSCSNTQSSEKRSFTLGSIVKRL